MEYLRGGTLGQRLRNEGALSEADVIRIGRELCSGLHAAHEKGLLHRDLKPSNIAFRETYGATVLTDFGLARRICDTDPLTEQGTPLGTPTYMSPEQINLQPLDARSDLFSLGSVLYEMATGQAPFRGETNEITFHAICKLPHLPVRQLRAEVSPGLAEVIDTLLHKDPNRRYGSAREASQALANLVADSTTKVRPRPWMAGVLVAATAAIVWWAANHRPPPATPPTGSPLLTSAAADLPLTAPHAGVAGKWQVPSPGRKADVKSLDDGGLEVVNAVFPQDWAMAYTLVDLKPEDMYCLVEVRELTGSETAGWYIKLRTVESQGPEFDLQGGQASGRFAIRLSSTLRSLSNSRWLLQAFVTGPVGSTARYGDVRLSESVPADYRVLDAVH
jgi:hypothetical protein